MAIGAISLVAAILILVARVAFGANASLGLAMIAQLTAASLSVNAILLAVIGEYLGRLYVQSKGRPLVIIEFTRNLRDPPSSIRAGDSR